MYRAVTFVALQRRIPVEDQEAVTGLAYQVQIDVRQSSRNSFKIILTHQKKDPFLVKYNQFCKYGRIDTVRI